MAADSKKAMDIVLAFGGKPGEKPEAEAGEADDEGVGLETAMEEFIAAVKAGDAKAAAVAFQSAMAHC